MGIFLKISDGQIEYGVSRDSHGGCKTEEEEVRVQEKIYEKYERILARNGITSADNLYWELDGIIFDVTGISNPEIPKDIKLLEKIFIELDDRMPIHKEPFGQRVFEYLLERRWIGLPLASIFGILWLLFIILGSCLLACMCIPCFLIMIILSPLIGLIKVGTWKPNIEINLPAPKLLQNGLCKLFTTSNEVFA